MRIIKLVEHKQRWSSDFKKESDKIQSVLSENMIATYHVGSTAITGILAKPVIDILVVVTSLGEVDKLNWKLEKQGYKAKGEHGIKGRRFFQKGGHERTHHLHIFETGNPEIERHKLFVEFMNVHPDRAAEYQTLKIKLANKYRDNPEKSSEGKSEFIQTIDLQAIEWKTLKSPPVVNK